MKKKQYLLAAAAICALSSNALADETIKLRIVSHATSVANQPIPDADGHALVLAKFEGLTSFPDGVGNAVITAISDYTHGSGEIMRTYWTVAAPDGSQLQFRTDKGQGTVKGGRTELNPGTVTIMGGTGRYAGAKGTGEGSGERLTSQLADGAMVYMDFTLNIKK
jgi:hypothetical protein